MGYFQSIMGYFMESWPVFLGYLAFQVRSFWKASSLELWATLAHLWDTWVIVAFYSRLLGFPGLNSVNLESVLYTVYA